MREKAKCRFWRCKGLYLAGLGMYMGFPWKFLDFFRFVLRSEISGVTRHAVFIRSAINVRFLGEITVWRRRRRLPFKCRCLPRIIGTCRFAILNAPEEVD